MDGAEGLLNVVDVEATCWDGEPSAEAVSEIIEIGLAVVGLRKGERVSRQLAAGHHAGARPWASWGECDRRQFIRQCRATGTQYPFGSRHTNVKRLFTHAYGLRKRPGMAEALRVAGLPLEGRHHSGADDAWNIAALVLALVRRGAFPAATTA